jgi:hypothetical protein
MARINASSFDLSSSGHISGLWTTGSDCTPTRWGLTEVAYPWNRHPDGDRVANGHSHSCSAGLRAFADRRFPPGRGRLGSCTGTCFAGRRLVGGSERGRTNQPPAAGLRVCGGWVQT